MFYSDKKVDRELVEQALYKAWKTTPSKNNAMAYQALVWGPDKKEEKIKFIVYAQKVIRLLKKEQLQKD